MAKRLNFWKIYFKPEIVLVERKKDFKYIFFKLSFKVRWHKKICFRQGGQEKWETAGTQKGQYLLSQSGFHRICFNSENTCDPDNKSSIKDLV